VFVHSDSFEIFEDFLINELDILGFNMGDEFLDDMVTVATHNKGTDVSFELCGKSGDESRLERYLLDQPLEYSCGTSILTQTNSLFVQ